MKTRVRWLLVGAVASLAFAPTASFAAEGSTAVSIPPGKTAPNATYVAAKTAIAREYAAAKTGRMPMTTFQAHEQAFESKWYGPSPKRPNGQAVAYGPCCVGHDIAVNQYPEPNYYFCGPAAAYSTLQYLGYMTSYQGEALTQDCLAGTCGSGAPNSRKYLETNYWTNVVGGNQKGTPWYVSAAAQPFSQSLNYCRTERSSRSYLHQFPSTEPNYTLNL